MRVFFFLAAYLELTIRWLQISVRVDLLNFSSRIERVWRKVGRENVIRRLIYYIIFYIEVHAP